MRSPRVALITYGDEREFEYYKLYEKHTQPRHEQAVMTLKSWGMTVLTCGEVARTKAQIDQQTAELRAQQPDVLIAHVPCWVSPNMACRGIEQIGLPTALVSNDSPATHATVGLLGAGGALDQIGYGHIRIRMEWNDPRLPGKLKPFLYAAAAKKQIASSTFGMFGGRSLGIDTGTFDPMQWRARFGVDTEHVDQSDIIRRAPGIAKDRVLKMTEFLQSGCKCVRFDNDKLTQEKLELQIRCYLATKDIITEKSLDFIALKCMPDMTVNYVAQCLSAAFLPSPFDGEGEKEVTPIACEADADAALTLMMLKELSGGMATWFADVSHIDMDTNTIYFPNCGGMCAWYAARSSCPEENLGRIELRFANRPAGGASTYFIAADGEITLARLTRYKGQYKMTAFLGRMRMPTDQELKKWIEARGIHQLPTAYIDVNIDLEHLVETFGSNHMAGVAGNHLDSVRRLCELYEIPCEFMDQT